MKQYYARTNKNMAVHQITRLEHREFALRKLNKLKGKTAPSGKAKGSSKICPNVSFEDSEALPYTPPEEHHHISKSRNFHMNIMAFLSSNQGDPAIIVSLISLLLTCLLTCYSFYRSFDLNSKSMFLRAFNILAGQVMAPSSRTKNADK